MDEPKREEIEQWIRVLPKRHPLRRRCERKPTYFPEQSEIVELLLETFQDSSRLRGHEHNDVARILGEIPLTSEQKIAVAKCLCVELVPRSPLRRRRLLRLGFSGLGKTLLTTSVLAYLFAIYMTTFSYSKEEWDFVGPFSSWAIILSFGIGIFILPVAALFMLPLIVALNSESLSRMRTTIANTLAYLCEPCSVSALAQAGCDRNVDVCMASRRALVTTLPTLTEEHYGTLSAETTPNLCHILEEICSAKPDFAVVLILALEKVGDGRAVETLENRLFLVPVAVRREADRILPLLRERKRQEEAQSMLLRASSEPSSPKEQLLRPVAGAPAESAPEQLLRATQASPE